MTSASSAESGIGGHATDDLWQDTVRAVPTFYGRLTCMAGLRDGQTGRYEHHGLRLVFGGDATYRAIRRCHLRSFREWMELPLDRRVADLDDYIVSPGGDRPVDAPVWLQLREWRNLIPTAVRGSERKLFVEEAELLIGRLIRRSVASGPDRAA